MIIQLKATGFELSTDLEKYAQKKLARLRRIIPKQLRTHAKCEIDFDLTKHGEIKYNTCTVTLSLGDLECKAQETTRHMYAALDIACVHVEHQLADYAAARRRHGLRHLLRAPFRRNAR